MNRPKSIDIMLLRAPYKMMERENQSAAIRLSASAAGHICAIAARRGAAPVLRLKVKGGGCSGLQYHFALEAGAGAAGDAKITAHGATLLVDADSAVFLAGAEVDYVRELMGEFFQIRNPNAVSSCGCGTSFAV